MFVKGVKSHYILAKIVKDCLNLKRYLKLARYNKKFQERLELSLENYKDYSQIKIEIILKKEELNQQNNYFIKMNGNREYYHFYFDDNDEEADRNYIYKGENVKKIKIYIDGFITNLSEMFQNCYFIEKIKFLHFSRSNVNNMSKMFQGCKKLYLI